MVGKSQGEKRNRTCSVHRDIFPCPEAESSGTRSVGLSTAQPLSVPAAFLSFFPLSGLCKGPGSKRHKLIKKQSLARCLS